MVSLKLTVFILIWVLCDRILPYEPDYYVRTCGYLGWIISGFEWGLEVWVSAF